MNKNKELAIQAGVDVSTIYRRKRNGQDVTAPPMSRLARAKRNAKLSPWSRVPAIKQRKGKE